MKAPLPEGEAARLEALRRYQVLDTDPESSYDAITRLASLIAQSPIAAVSLVDDDRQWFKSSMGLTLRETARDQAFCAHTILQRDIMVVEDATRDGRFAENRFVTGSLQIRFYAAAPLLTPDGHALGALCVMDSRPKQLNLEQKEGLGALARLVVEALELRRVSADLAASSAKVKTLSGLLPICCFCKGIRSDEGYWQRLEAYLALNTDASLTHGICPACLQRHFPDTAENFTNTFSDLTKERTRMAHLLREGRRLMTDARQQVHQIDQLWAAQKETLRKHRENPPKPAPPTK